MEMYSGKEKEKKKNPGKHLLKMSRTTLFQHQTIELLCSDVSHASSDYLHTIKSSCQLPVFKMWTLTFERVLLIDLSGA